MSRHGTIEEFDSATEDWTAYSERTRQNGNVATFVSELRQLAMRCDFGASLEEMLRDRLVCGIKDEHFQRRLLAEPNLTFKKAQDIAQALESADRSTADLQQQVQVLQTTIPAFGSENKCRKRVGEVAEREYMLSHLPLPECPADVPTPGETVLLMETLQPSPVNMEEIRTWTKEDPVLSKVKGLLINVTIEKMKLSFAYHGLPVLLVTDNGSNFTSQEFETFLKSHGVRHIRTAPYHPASNGLVERAVQTFKTAMKKSVWKLSLQWQQLILLLRHIQRMNNQSKELMGTMELGILESKKRISHFS
eukprot:Em0016g713a